MGGAGDRTWGDPPASRALTNRSREREKRGGPAAINTADMRRHFSMVREFHLADLFTLANAGSGMGAIFAVMAALRSERQMWLVSQDRARS